MTNTSEPSEGSGQKQMALTSEQLSRLKTNAQAAISYYYRIKASEPTTVASKTRPIQIRDVVDDRDGFLIEGGEPSSQTNGDGTNDEDDTDTSSTGDSNIPDPPGDDQPDTIPGDWPEPFSDGPDPTDPNTPSRFETAAAYCFAVLYQPMESPLDPEVWGAFADTVKRFCDEGNQPPLDLSGILDE